MSRGIRNNNPGNIRKNATKWQGLSDTQTDSAFFQFKEMKWGIRAMLKTLNTYYYKHDRKTIRQMVYRWAPPQDNNNTELYIKVVSDRTRIDDNVKLPIDNRITMCAIAQAMCWMENSVEIPIDEFYKGWELM